MNTDPSPVSGEELADKYESMDDALMSLGAGKRKSTFVKLGPDGTDD
jgi:hypothetical protein